MNVVRKVAGILLALFVISIPIWFSSGASESLSSNNGRSVTNSNSQTDTPVQTGVTVSDPVVPSLSPAVRDLPPYQQEFVLDREVNPRMGSADGVTAYSTYEGGLDPLLAVQANAPDRAIDAFSTPIVNMDGQGFTNVNPPDTVGDVGLNHYIQAINQSGGSLVQIYDKTGTPAVAAFSMDSLGSGNCADGLGDPVVLYDRLADRWMLTEFSSNGNQLCVYISQTADPTGSYYNYAFTAVHDFPDYPKYGVWPDAYYVGTNEGPSHFYALDRNAMLTGAAATMQNFAGTNLSGFGFQMIIPSDLDGATPPPAGSPNYFMRHRDTETHGQGNCPVDTGGDCLEIFEFTVDWNTPANSGINGPIPIQIAEFDSDLCGLSSFYCFPQPGSSTTLDPLREVVMNRLQYRNFGTHEVLVGNFVTDVDGSDHGGIRWFELRKSGAEQWSLYQEGTYAPDASHRWMGSIAMDGSGDIAVGYNVSDASATYPSLRYTGRLNSDPLNTMPQGEYSIVAGSSPNGSNRYGDYSAMGVDPADDCTFWFTGMYNSAANWSTRIASFKFDSCTGAMSPNFGMVTTPATQDICYPDAAGYTIDLAAVGGFTGDVNLVASGNPGTATFTYSTVTLDGSSALDITGAAVGNYSFDVIGTGVTTPTLVQTNTIGLNVFAGTPSVPTLVAPVNGASDIPTLPTFVWNTLSDATSYFIQIATDANFTNIVDSATVATNEYTTAVVLNTSTTYYWRVRANNGCGTGTYTAAFSFSTLAAPGDCGPGTVPSLLYNEDFEGGTDIWTHSGTGDTWAISTAQSNSGSYAYNAEDTADISEQQLESPDVLLPNANFPLSLQFWNQQTMEDSSGGCYDGAILEISTNGGSSWTQLDSELLSDPYDGAISSSYNNPLAGRNAWCGDPQAWLNSIIDLNAYAGETVRFRFSLGTDSSVGREGWYIDDVKVQSCVAAGDAPVIQVEPAAISSAQVTNAQVTKTFAISNTGTAVLEWNIFEDSTSSCSSVNDISWISGLSAITGTVPIGNADMVNVVFDSTGMSAGTYTADLCVNSNDPVTSQVAVPVTMTVGDFNFATYLPFIATPAQPDLVIDSINTTATSLEVVITNNSAASIGSGFWVDLYINPVTPPSGINQTWETNGGEGLAWGINDGVAAGETITLTLSSPYYVASKSNFSGTIAAGSALYAQVDSVGGFTYGAILESDETNNLMGPLTTSVEVTPSHTFANVIPSDALMALRR